MSATPCGHRHAVLFYKDHAFARDSVSHYLAAALRSGAPALLIARPALLAHVQIDLHRQHVQGIPFGPGRGSLATWDAHATLERICRDGKPDPELFEAVLGQALTQLTRDGLRPVAYGEMVDILCERGRFADAIALENLWNGLLARFDASLFCGYASARFDAPEAAPFAEAIRAAHGRAHDETTGPIRAWV
jgi:hypothetical protein